MARYPPLRRTWRRRRISGSISQRRSSTRLPFRLTVSNFYKGFYELCQKRLASTKEHLINVNIYLTVLPLRPGRFRLGGAEERKHPDFEECNMLEFALHFFKKKLFSFKPIGAFLAALKTSLRARATPSATRWVAPSTSWRGRFSAAARQSEKQSWDFFVKLLVNSLFQVRRRRPPRSRRAPRRLRADRRGERGHRVGQRRRRTGDLYTPIEYFGNKNLRASHSNFS